MEDHPRVIVGVVIMNDDGDILLGKGNKWDGKWTIFGGHVEYGEALEAAVIRETKEETGLDITDVRFLGLQESIFDPKFHKKRHFIYLDYAARGNGEPIFNEEFSDAKWIKPADLEQYDILDSCKVAIKNALKDLS